MLNENNVPASRQIENFQPRDDKLFINMLRRIVLDEPGNSMKLAIRKVLNLGSPQTFKLVLMTLLHQMAKGGIAAELSEVVEALFDDDEGELLQPLLVGLKNDATLAAKENIQDNMYEAMLGEPVADEIPEADCIPEETGSAIADEIEEEGAEPEETYSAVGEEEVKREEHLSDYLNSPLMQSICTADINQNLHLLSAKAQMPAHKLIVQNLRIGTPCLLVNAAALDSDQRRL